MRKSETIAKLAEALAAAQSEMEFAKKDQLNPHFGRKYADLASVLEAVKAPLAKYKLAVVQLCEPTDGNVVCIETVLMHASGEWVSSVLTLPADKATPQGFGSAITYARRYGLSAILGVAPDEDDDGEEAERSVAQRRPQTAPTRAASNPSGQPPLTQRSSQPAAEIPQRPTDSFEALKRDLEATAAGQDGHEDRLRISKRVLFAQGKNLLTKEQVADLRALYDTKDKAAAA